MEIDKFIKFNKNYIEERTTFKNKFLKERSMFKRTCKRYKDKEFENLFKADIHWLEKYKNDIFHPNGLKIQKDTEEYISIEELKEVIFYLKSHVPKLQARINSIFVIIAIFSISLVMFGIYDLMVMFCIYDLIPDELGRFILKFLGIVTLIIFSAYVGQELVNINERQAIYKELQYLIENRLQNTVVQNAPNLQDL